MRNSFGEALIVVTALVGFVALNVRDAVTLDDVWTYSVALGITAAFYTLLLLVRAVFTFMTGEDKFWWEKYAEQKKPHRWGKK